MNIIITGSSGFVGQNVLKYLKKYGNIIDALSLRKENWSLNKNANAIIHLAGKAHDVADASDDREYYTVNTDLTAKLFDAFLKSEMRDFFYFSSVKASADSVAGTLKESDLPNPKTAYGKSKLAAEEYLLSHKLPENKRLFIIRPCMVHGPGNKGNLNLLYKFVEKGIPWPLAGFDNQRSFLSIDNLNFLLLKILITPDIPSGIYNFADDETLATNAVVKIMANTAGKKEKLWKIDVSLITKLAQVGDRLKLPLNTERLKKLTENYIVSNQKIKNALHLKQLPLTAEEGLIKTIKSFQK